MSLCNYNFLRKKLPWLSLFYLTDYILLFSAQRQCCTHQVAVNPEAQGHCLRSPRVYTLVIIVVV